LPLQAGLGDMLPWQLTQLLLLQEKTPKKLGPQLRQRFKHQRNQPKQISKVLVADSHWLAAEKVQLQFLHQVSSNSSNFSPFFVPQISYNSLGDKSQQIANREVAQILRRQRLLRHQFLEESSRAVIAVVLDYSLQFFTHVQIIHPPPIYQVQYDIPVGVYNTFAASLRAPFQAPQAGLPAYYTP